MTPPPPLPLASFARPPARPRSRPEFFQLSAQFPGPTAPRDFVTLLVTSESSAAPSGLRQYMVVSKPCTHPDCPPRRGIICGRYELVEVVREIAAERPASEGSPSRADPTSAQAAGSGAARPTSAPSDSPRAVEWLMVTRSDPGGSVPRFMIDRGTPPGIVGDAAKFLDWAAAAAQEEPLAQEESVQDDKAQDPAARSPDEHVATASAGEGEGASSDQGAPSSNGLYGIITGAFGAASSVAHDLRQQLSGPLSLGSHGHDGAGPDDLGDDPGSESDASTSSARSFASALEGSAPASPRAARTRSSSTRPRRSSTSSSSGDGSSKTTLPRRRSGSSQSGRATRNGTRRRWLGRATSTTRSWPSTRPGTGAR